MRKLRFWDSKWPIIPGDDSDLPSGDFLGGPVVRTPPSITGTMGSIPGWGTKIPYAEGQLSLCATTREACVLRWRATHFSEDLARSPHQQKILI